MRILMLGWGFPPRIQGGLDTHVYEISRELAKNNRVLLALPERNCPGKKYGGIEIISVKCPSSGRASLLKSVKAYNRDVFAKCRNLRFDLVHSHDWFGVDAAERLREKTGRPWVFSLHSLEYMRSCSTGRGSVMERLERKGAKKCDRIVTVSRFMKREIAGRYGISSGKIDVVYNSARPGKARHGEIRKRFGLGKRPVALFLGRLSSQKGVEHVISSARLVLDKLPEARFIIAGEGHLRESLERFSRHLGLEGKILFTGFVPESDLYSYYSDADVFVSPSLCEPFGIAALESLLSGTPVIIGENSGLVEKIPGMKCVMTVRPGTRELPERIISCLENRRAVSAKERGVLEKAYSWGRSASQLAGIYSKLI